MYADQVPPHDVVIAPVVAEDAGELLTLQRAAYATEARIYGDPELPALIQTLAELQDELATATALKASLGHRIVGAVRAHLDGTVLHVGRLTVAPDWQGRGIGSRLLSAIESHHGDHVNTAALFTGHLSESNLAMYARRGYLEQRREQLRPGVVLVHLTKPLLRTTDQLRR
jgi:GNAT superfamily N-acetyltransferase